MITFFRSLGFDGDYINKRIKEWNELNEPKLREGYVKAQISWFKRQKKVVLPPNCENPGYYKTMGVKCEDSICKMCKNPVNYVFRRLKVAKEQRKK